MNLEDFAPSLADWIEKHPHWGMLASAAGFGASFMSLLNTASAFMGFAGALFGLCAGYYTFRIKRDHWKKAQHAQNQKHTHRG